MQGEIKFRGKMIDNGEWVYGDYGRLSVRLKDGTEKICHYIGADLAFRQVDPETVGQLTGLKDKNDKGIYKSDICRTFKDFQDEVVYQDGAFGYCVEHQGFISFAENHNFHWKNGKSEHIEVIGNVFDNPELLEQE